MEDIRATQPPLSDSELRERSDSGTVQQQSGLTAQRAVCVRLDCRTRMAHVTLAAPITGLSGKLSKSHAVVFNMRQAPTNNERMINMPCYTNWRDPQKVVALTDNQKNWNTQFAQIAAATRERMVDPAFLPGDQAAYAQQSKFKTFYSFVFNICKEEILNGK